MVGTHHLYYKAPSLNEKPKFQTSKTTTTILRKYSKKKLGHEKKEIFK